MDNKEIEYDGIVNTALEKLEKLTGEDFHGYRSEVWNVVSAAIQDALKSTQARVEELEAHIPCLVCNEPVFLHLAYRCYDCDAPMHKECIKVHCNQQTPPVRTKFADWEIPHPQKPEKSTNHNKYMGPVEGIEGCCGVKFPYDGQLPNGYVYKCPTCGTEWQLSQEESGGASWHEKVRRLKVNDKRAEQIGKKMAALPSERQGEAREKIIKTLCRMDEEDRNRPVYHHYLNGDRADAILALFPVT